MREDIPAASKRKICIVGFADGHRDDAPWDDEEMEFWGLNRLHAVLAHRLPKFSRWFELHSLKKFYLDNNDTQHAQFLHDFHGPVYIRPDDVGLMNIPNAEPFPISHILDRYPDYFTNSVSWMMALAIEMLRPLAEQGQETELHVYGVDMAQDQLLMAEYGRQRPSCEYFLGAAAASGITVFIPEGSDLLKASHRYGFDDTDPIRGKYESRHRELAARKAQLANQLKVGDEQRAQLIAGLNQLDGALQEVQYQLRNIMPPAETVPEPPKVEIGLDTIAGGIAHLQQQIAALTPAEDAKKKGK